MPPAKESVILKVAKTSAPVNGAAPDFVLAIFVVVLGHAMARTE